MSRYPNILIALLIHIACFICFTSSAQTNAIADSLKVAFDHASSDTQKVNILLAWVPEIACSDRSNKLSYANQAKDLSEKRNWTNGMIRSNLLLGNVYFGCINDYTKALSFFLTADSLAKKAADDRSDILALNYIAAVYQKLGQYKEAIEIYRSAITLNPDPDEEMGIWGNLGVEYNSIGDYNQALSCYYKSLKILTQLQGTNKTNDPQDVVQMAGLLLNIGDVYMEMAQPDKAFENYDSVYKLGVATKFQIMQVIGLMGMGEVYYTQKKYDKSIECYQNALETCTQRNDFNGEIKILNKLANAFLGKGDLNMAMDFAKRSLKLAEEKANSEQLPRVYITLGKVYAEQSAYNNATDYLQKALNISQQTGAINDEKDAWFALISTYKQMNQPAKALEAYEHFITIRDSVYNIAKANEFTRQEMDFNYKNKQQADKLIYEQKIAQQQLYTYGGFAGLVLVILLSFFIYRNYNTQKKYNELLSREKKHHLAHIEAQDIVLSDIAHIQAHEVRGPVATILGLVQIFNRENPMDPINKEVIDGLNEITEKLDTVVKEVIVMENKLKAQQGEKNKKDMS